MLVTAGLVTPDEAVEAEAYLDGLLTDLSEGRATYAETMARVQEHAMLQSQRARARAESEGTADEHAIAGRVLVAQLADKRVHAMPMPATCPTCRTRFHATINVLEDPSITGAEPGDIGICNGCAAVLLWIGEAPDLAVRLATDADLVDLPSGISDMIWRRARGIAASIERRRELRGQA